MSPFWLNFSRSPASKFVVIPFVLTPVCICLMKCTSSIFLARVDDGLREMVAGLSAKERVEVSVVLRQWADELDGAVAMEMGGPVALLYKPALWPSHEVHRN